MNEKIRITGKIVELPHPNKYFGKSTFSHIMQKSGRKPTVCRCEKCKSQCHTPCLGTPEDIYKLMDAGYADRLAVTEWWAGVLMGVCDIPVVMIQARQEDNGWCTFRRDDGLCELHDKGLKPTEGRLSHHSIRMDNFNPKKSISWLVAKEWLSLQQYVTKRLSTVKIDVEP